MTKFGSRQPHVVEMNLNILPELFANTRASDGILHLNPDFLAKTIDKLQGMQINAAFETQVNNFLSKVLGLMLKTSEMIQLKVLSMFNLIVKRVKVNHVALIPYFSCATIISLPPGR